MGICGTGVGALAGLLRDSGFTVSGSDQNVYPPMSDFLANLGITVMKGYSAANLEPRPDLVVVGNVIRRDNPEALALVEARVPYVSMPQALGSRFLKEKTSLVVAGTHGKTTTASVLVSALAHAGKSPGCLIGGLVKVFERNYNLGSGPYFVVEGDEYDTAFFDKGPKFLHYHPGIAVITSIEFDHADIYADLEAVKQSFRKLVAIMPEDGCLIVHGDDPAVTEVAGEAKCKVLRYGQGAGFEWVFKNMQIRRQVTGFDVLRQGTYYGRVENVLPGRHNALNSLAVVAVLDHLGLTRDEILGGIAAFEGVRRRQEVRGVVNDITVIDDFAHHPTAVRETLAALTAKYNGQRLIAVFDPRTNTSRRNFFQKDYVRSFAACRQVIVREPEGMENIPPDQRFSSPALVEDLQAEGVDAHYFKTTDEVIEYLVAHAGSGDVVVILSNGGFDNIHDRLLRKLR